MKAGCQADKRPIASWPVNKLLSANETMFAARIERDEPVTRPGIPAGFSNPESLVTADCIRPFS